MPSIRVAVPQWEPTWLDKTATTQKALNIIKEAANNGARLVAFGELVSCGQASFRVRGHRADLKAIPGYPTYLYGGRMNDLYEHSIKYVCLLGRFRTLQHLLTSYKFNNSLEVNGPEIAAIRHAAKENNIIGKLLPTSDWQAL
jgi:hypothetical protein